MHTFTSLPKPPFRLLQRSRLTVSTILREAPETVMRFVAWYLRQDADRIVLCFEDPEDPAIALVEGIARVECIRCTPEFWVALGLDPQARFSKRQNKAMSYVYSTVAGGWFLNVDCDELVHLEGRTLADELDRQPDKVRGVRIITAENIHTPDHEGLHFRCAMSPFMQRRAYRDSVPGMSMKMGLFGHYLGKTATRSGLTGLSMRQHWMLTEEKEIVNDVVLGPIHGAYLLHFNDHGFRWWCGKLPERMQNRWFQARIRDLILDALALPEPEPELRKLYDIFFVFDRARLAALGRAGARFDLALDPDEVAVQYFRNRAA